jgi:hypothetical protein
VRLIYPADTFSPKSVDEVYADEFAEAQSLGFATSLFSFEDFQAETFRPRPPLQSGETVLFRCWMMTPDDYARLFSGVESIGGRALTSPESYRLCHHLPEWYPILRDHTAETRFYSEDADIVSDLAAADWSGCFLKDYVKSLSTDGGSLVRTLSDIPAVIAKMRKYRGCIEGGLCARRIEDYDTTSERRYFVWRGTAHSSDAIVPELVQLAASRVSSPFFTVDVAQRRDGALRIVELGDGQVSDRKQWSSHDLLSLLR